ncbi:MAG: AI-2E family transporter [Actinomycetota bacterium]|nr:AI-2E family transporter [Actinomycetota bacterium]
MTDERRRWEESRYVVVRVVLVVLGIGLGVALAVLLTWQLRRIVTLVVVGAFFATLLNPLVDALTRRLRMRRGLATSIVFLLGVGAFSGLGYLVVSPLVDAGQRFADDIPGFVERAERGEGRVGELIKRYKVEEFVRENAPKLRERLNELGGPAVRTVQTVATGAFAVLTILVLTFLILLEAPGVIVAFLAPFSERHRQQLRRIGRDAGRAVSGYMAGNLLISLVAGTVTYVTLRIVGVPFANVLAVWVGFADLIPLVGATLGAIPTVFVAFLHSTGAGVAVLIVYIVYQQIENHVLQPVVMSRTVKLNPLLVLLAVLVGVELAGFVGALLAIPAAGVVQVVVRDLWDERQARLKPVPTTGTDETPMAGTA